MLIIRHGVPSMLDGRYVLLEILVMLKLDKFVFIKKIPFIFSI